MGSEIVVVLRAKKSNPSQGSFPLVNKTKTLLRKCQNNTTRYLKINNIQIYLFFKFQTPLFLFLL
jgi:hypothetical protein